MCIRYNKSYAKSRAIRTLATAPRKAREAISGSPFESATTRPTWDTYSARFFLSLIVAVLLITDWSSVSAMRLPSVSSTPSLLGESFTRNHFSAWQVVAITVFIFQIILDRCLYTLISHSPSVGTLSEQHREFNTRTTFHRKLVLASVTIQFVLLVAAMNLRLVNRFFIPYCMYLVLTARQLAFDIRPVGGKTGGILWSPGSMSYYAFRLYLAIPFLDELRQICDWVASPSTCLSLYMWFKVEDCMQNLRSVQAEMDSRDTLPLTRGDRSCVGVSAIVGLVAIITGPLVFFSGLNVLREQNPIVSTVPGEAPSSLRIFLQVPPNVPHLTLYTSNQLSTEGISTETVKDEVLAPLLVMKSADLQRISFPEASDSQWAISDTLRTQLMEALTVRPGNVSVTAEWTLDRQLSPFTTSITATSSVSSKALMDAIQAPEGGSVDMPNLIPSVAYLDSSPFAKVISEEGVRAGTRLKLSKDNGEWWNLIDPDRQGILCLGERTMGSGSTPGSGGSSYAISVIGLYIGVVLTVGRFLRLSMQGSSKRIGVEELPSTETPMQICQGIHIARLFKDVETEKKLYYDLVKLFRDPELLLAPRALQTHEIQRISSYYVTNQFSPKKYRSSLSALSAICESENEARSIRVSATITTSPSCTCSDNRGSTAQTCIHDRRDKAQSESDTYSGKMEARNRNRIPSESSSSASSGWLSGDIVRRYDKSSASVPLPRILHRLNPFSPVSLVGTSLTVLVEPSLRDDSELWSHRPGSINGEQIKVSAKIRFDISFLVGDRT